jgi:hypothetical protein
MNCGSVQRYIGCFVIGLSMGDYVDAKPLVIHLGCRDEHGAAGEKRHEYNEHRTSFSWHMRHVVVNWEED